MLEREHANLCVTARFQSCTTNLVGPHGPQASWRSQSRSAVHNRHGLFRLTSVSYPIIGRMVLCSWFSVALTPNKHCQGRANHAVKQSLQLFSPTCERASLTGQRPIDQASTTIWPTLLPAVQWWSPITVKPIPSNLSDHSTTATSVRLSKQGHAKWIPRGQGERLSRTYASSGGKLPLEVQTSQIANQSSMTNTSVESIAKTGKT